MHRFAACLIACSVSVVCAQDSGPLFDKLASKDDAEVKAGHSGLVALGDAIVPEIERRLGKKPGERLASRLRAVLASINTGGLDALLTPRFELPEAGGVPALISPDGKHVAYAAKSENDGGRVYEYRVATLSDDGEPKVKTLLQCGEEMRDDFMVPALQPGAWSPDSRYLGLVDANGSRRVTQVAYVEVATGKVTELGSGEGEMHLGLRFHPNGGQVAWVKLLQNSAPDCGVLVRDLKTGETTQIETPEDFVAVDLRYLPDGRLFALGAIAPGGDLRGRPEGRMCVISADGKSAKLLEGSIEPDDFFWGGPPILLHVPGTTRVLCESRTEQGKRPSRILLFDADKDAGKELVAESDYALVSMIDAKRACVWTRGDSDEGTTKSAGILDLESGEVTRLEHERLLVHRRGKRAVMLDMDNEAFSIN